MMKRLAVLSLCAIAAFAQNTASTMRCLEKKIIEYGWDVQNSSYVEKNIREMEKKPFDGIIFRLRNGGRIFDFSKPDPKSFEPDFLSCQNIKWDKFTDNFVILYAASEQDWFNDEHWNNILERTKLMTRAAKLAKCKGICFDQEPYGFNPWSYLQAKHKNEKSFAEYETVVRKRGAQFMKAVESEMPGLDILTFFQLTYHQPLLHTMEPARRAEVLSNNTYAFLPAFINGMLDAATPEVRIIDGNETAYYYTTSEEYFRKYFLIKQTALLLIAPENIEKYRRQMTVGQALYIDQYFDMRSSRFLSAYMTKEEQQKWFKHNVYWSLFTTDRYVWCYSERMNWWFNKTVPEGAEQAIIEAKKLIAEDRPLGYTMTEIETRAKAKIKKEKEQNLKIKNADIKKLPKDIQPPVIDGKLDDAIWAKVTPLGNFTALVASRDKNPKAPTTVWFTYDNENIYIAFKCAEPNIKNLKCYAKGHDNDGIWLGDDVEFFISLHEKPVVPFAHFISDAKGTTWDAIHTPETDTKFNPKWICAAKTEEKQWTVEASIPWAELKMTCPQPGTKLRGNFCRQNMASHELSSWSILDHGFLESDLYAVFNFIE